MTHPKILMFYKLSVTHNYITTPSLVITAEFVKDHNNIKITSANIVHESLEKITFAAQLITVLTSAAKMWVSVLLCRPSLQFQFYHIVVDAQVKLFNHLGSICIVNVDFRRVINLPNVLINKARKLSRIYFLLK